LKKTQIIRGIIGENLKDYGFSFLKTDGACRIFIREVQGVKRYPAICDELRQIVLINENGESQIIKEK
jgi:hypothetical protein